MNEKTLGQDGWFWGFIGLGAVFSLISLGFIIYSDNLIWCGSSRCFSDALEIFRFPVQTFTAGIALATLRALMFRSEQTAKQIEISNMQIAETTKQNLVKNFFEHRKDFSELLMGIEKDYGLKFRKRNGLYFSIFPENGFYYFSPDSTGSRFKVPQLIKWVTDFNIIIRGFKSEVHHRYIQAAISSHCWFGVLKPNVFLGRAFSRLTAFVTSA